MEQRERTAQLIIQAMKDDLSELSYTLSKYVRTNNIVSTRSLLDREAINKNFVDAIAVFEDKKFIVGTDPKYIKAVRNDELLMHNTSSVYDSLLKQKALQTNVHYYDGKVLKRYQLVFFINQKAILNSFLASKKTFLISFLFLPMILVALLWILMRSVIMKPLETLRQYAYYQSFIPKKLRIKELEYIRSSMVQTFTRLDQEKQDLYNLARTDSLSGLANRNLLQERVEQIIANCKRSHKEFALLFLDLDHFKSINDSLGHDVGDELLKSIAGVIEEEIRINDVVARIGGDEFVIVLTHYKDNVELVEIINRIQHKIMRPWVIQTYPINISSSIGVALYPKDGENLLGLMKNADIAMYQAKDNGRKQYSFFTHEINEKIQHHIELTNSMKMALTNDEYALYYQPQNDVKTGEIIGAEALIRWISPKEGIIPPDTFIGIAEKNGFIVELGDWILETALQQKYRWEQKNIDLKLSINVAAKQLLENDFIEKVYNLLEKYPVNTSKLSFEITEYIFLENSNIVLEKFKALKMMGIKLSLDDFGTGYSSLSYLKRFPLDIVKIDKAFLDDYKSEDGAVFLETIIKMGQTLKLRVVAEGVEDEAQLCYLQQLDCDMYQGYICSKPVDIEAFESLYNKVLG